MDIQFIKHTENWSTEKGVLVRGMYEDRQFLDAVHPMNEKHKSYIEKTLEFSKFKGKKGEVFSLWCPYEETVTQVFLVGLGKKESVALKDIEEAGGHLMAALMSHKCEQVNINLDGIAYGDEGVACFASGMDLRVWQFDKYKTKDKPDQGPQKIILKSEDVDVVQKAFDRRHAVNLGNFLTREVISEPPNVLYPESMAEIAKSLSTLGLEVEVLGESEMKKLGMNALLGVGQGSEKESKLIVIQWKGNPNSDEKIAFVGKGVTFDTGGISIKPSNNMEDMKYDMGGSGVVLGLMKALATRKAKVNVVGVMGMAENMPSGSAQRPADVVTSMSGQTIEVINTDAEGRLVLADALWYTQDRFKPKAMIDLATLTGAIVVAIGHEYAGLFSNNDQLAQQITDVGCEVGEQVWRFPMGPQYDRDINSDIADVKNVGSGRGAGSITAAQFLERFVNKTPWVHLDIAGVAWEKKAKPLTGKGATGFGVRLLDRFVEKYYEV